MSLKDFSFPEFVPLGLIGRAYGAIKAEPTEVNVEEDLPCRFMFGSLQKGSFRKTDHGWSASYRHSTAETFAKVTFDGTLAVSFSWRGREWVITTPGLTFRDPQLCVYPTSLDEEMKENIQERYNLTYIIPSRTRGVECYFPDGPPRCIVFPIRISDLGTARKALLSMENDEAIGAPLFGYATIGLSTVDYNLQMASASVLDRFVPIPGSSAGTELPPFREPEMHKLDDGTEVLRVTRRQYLAVFHTFFCDLERVAQWLKAFPLLSDARDATHIGLVNIEYGFVCQGSELTDVTMEWKSKTYRITRNIRFDPSNLVSLRNSGAELDKMIEEIERKSIELNEQTDFHRQ